MGSTTSPNALVNKLGSILQTLDEDIAALGSDPEERTKVLGALEKIRSAAQQPAEKILSDLATPAEKAITRLFIHWKVFELLPEDGSGISFEEIAEKTEADVNIIRRFGALLVASGVLVIVNKDKVAHSELSRIYATRNPVSSAFKHFYDIHLLSFASIIRYFDTYGRREPIGARHCMFSFASGHPEKTLGEIAEMYPEIGTNAAVAMTFLNQSLPTDILYDFTWLVAHAKGSTERPLLVDVGGSKGHCLKAICEKTPDLPPSRCILEDREAILEVAKQIDDPILKEIQMVPVNFHMEQPVKGALVYHIRACLHDYDDTDSIEILRHLSDAMAQDSKLLIVEQVLTWPPHPMSATSDVCTAVGGGIERSLDQFKSLVGHVGLEIRNVFTVPGGSGSVIECTKV